MSPPNPDTSAAAPPSAPPPAALDVTTSMRNALKLGGSLMVTYGIAMTVRLMLPRVLGPEAFGQFNWASEGFTAVFFVLAGLGLEVYIRKEVALRPHHASEFFGGTLLLQVLLAIGLLGAMQGLMHLEGKPAHLKLLVLLLGVYQLFFRCNGTLAAVLHAREKVDGLSVANIATKCVWGGGQLLVLALGLPLPWLGVPILASELVRAVVLYRLARRHTGLELRVDGRGTRSALTGALPFFLNEAALAANGPMGVFLLGFLTNTTEVGWYGAGWNLAGMTLMAAPVLTWVMIPLLSRASAHSPQELDRLTRRTLEAVLAFSIPLTLAMGLGADVWIGVVYGEAFAPAAAVLRLQAPILTLTYVAMVCASVLTVTGKGWWVTRTSVVSMVLNSTLNLTLARPFLAWFGPVGGACASALALFTCEAVTVTLLVSAVGRRAFDRQSLTRLGKTLAVCAVVTGAHLSLSGLGPVRLAVGAALYLFLVFATGAVRLDELQGLLRVVRRRGAPVQASAA
ncbi:oligosaccharide flippase family protein [Hyalangium rubrum]|uniref:Oligosaccharide flippase family protein n=1 Tax=Hyalangium rubrum TaxID=3103134 RepID=A0ABU5GYR4_9BACT|nr:oligosaccharide flippase family protein [Hyalangium sp. s54d21]MDY7226012.1 oligosaccharide flippase family protein [Hyalangium sp. s54d21]